MSGRRIIDYFMIEADSPEDLASLMREFIADGWQPYGSPVATIATTNDAHHAFYYCQAITREED
jgi:hypothetical protein